MGDSQKFMVAVREMARFGRYIAKFVKKSFSLHRP